MDIWQKASSPRHAGSCIGLTYGVISTKTSKTCMRKTERENPRWKLQLFQNPLLKWHPITSSTVCLLEVKPITTARTQGEEITRVMNCGRQGSLGVILVPTKVTITKLKEKTMTRTKYLQYM